MQYANLNLYIILSIPYCMVIEKLIKNKISSYLQESSPIPEERKQHHYVFHSYKLP